MVSSILSVCDCSDLTDGLGETRDGADLRLRGETFNGAGDIGGDERRSFLDGLSGARLAPLERDTNLLLGGILAMTSSSAFSGRFTGLLEPMLLCLGWQVGLSRGQKMEKENMTQLICGRHGLLIPLSQRPDRLVQSVIGRRAHHYLVHCLLWPIAYSAPAGLVRVCRWPSSCANNAAPTRVMIPYKTRGPFFWPGQGTSSTYQYTYIHTYCVCMYVIMTLTFGMIY